MQVPSFRQLVLLRLAELILLDHGADALDNVVVGQTACTQRLDE